MFCDFVLHFLSNWCCVEYVFFYLFSIYISSMVNNFISLIYFLLGLVTSLQVFLVVMNTICLSSICFTNAFSQLMIFFIPY